MEVIFIVLPLDGELSVFRFLRGCLCGRGEEGGGKGGKKVGGETWLVRMLESGASGFGDEVSKTKFLQAGLMM